MALNQKYAEIIGKEYPNLQALLLDRSFNIHAVKLELMNLVANYESTIAEEHPAVKRYYLT